MLLSLSSAAVEVETDLNSIKGNARSIEGIAAAEELVNFTDSVHRLDGTLTSTRTSLIEAIGIEGMVDAAIISSVFRSLNITADSSGIRIDDDWETTAAALASETGAQDYRTLENSPNVKSMIGQHK
ncbi:MAG: hypothetical protein P8L22_05200 [Acidimicrobiales bacterium]|nr:hypothetical protein [Acidimicrobiales bacterium]